MAKSKTEQALRKIAIRYPGAEEGIACKGTKVESPTFMVGKRAFLFVNSTVARLRLGESQKSAAKLAAKEPNRYNVGAGGWSKISYGENDVLPLDLLAKWVDESYRSMTEPAAKKVKKAASGA
jgi:hypothetical protein